MHIVYVTTELETKNNPSGGLASYTANMAEIFAEKGNKVSVIVVTTKETHYDSFNCCKVYNVYIQKDEWNNLDHIAHILHETSSESADSIRKVLVNIRKSELLKEKISQLDKENKVDIVHYCNHDSLSLQHNVNIPYVIRISGYLNILFGKADTPDGSIQYKDNPPLLRDKVEALTLKKARYVISPSRLLADIGEKEFGINCSVLESPFVKKKVEWDYSVRNKLNKKYILYYGTMRFLKGIHVVARLSESFLDKYQDMVLVLAGNDVELQVSEDEKIFASDYVRKHSGQFVDRVIYLGNLKREKLYPVIEGAELCIFPSRIENLSNACIEAMGIGKIVVATKGASFEQLIEDGENGFLCERDNAGCFLEEIEKVLAMETSDREQVELNAKRRVERLSPEKVYCRFYEFYEKVIEDWK